MLKKDEYFTAGQLASLYGIPKQTLLYYDKNELLTPAFVNDKGYRYYSVSQYLILEIILNMRKLNISINDIKEYLTNRSPEKFEQILRAKEKECNTIIEEMQKMKNSLALSLNSIACVQKVQLEQIELTGQAAKPFLISEDIGQTKSVRERIKILAHHNQTTFSKKHFKEFTTGWIIDRNDFINQKFNRTLKYFTPVPASFPPKYCCLRPEGLYLSINFQGTYYQRASDIYDKIKLFVDRNHLSIISNIYILPLKNHWMTEDITTYINQISFQVQYDSD